MMDSAAVKRDQVASLSTISSEHTLRLGAAHGDAKDIGLLFFSPSKVRLPVEAPPLFADDPEAPLSDHTQTTDVAAEEKPPEDPKPRASWLDAVWVQGEHGVPARRDATFPSDDNGLYLRFLPETV